MIHTNRVNPHAMTRWLPRATARDQSLVCPKRKIIRGIKAQFAALYQKVRHALVDRSINVPIPDLRPRQKCGVEAVVVGTVSVSQAQQI
jgi:hypothetical protein